jgi:hypothetical protein
MYPAPFLPFFFLVCREKCFRLFFLVSFDYAEINVDEKGGNYEQNSNTGLWANGKIHSY